MSEMDDGFADLDDGSERCDECGSEDIDEAPEELSGLYFYRCCACVYVSM